MHVSKTMGIDFSFLRLSDSFAKAKNVGDPKYSDKTLWRYDCICLHPLETYIQKTNSPVNVAFNNDYKVEIIDCSETGLKDITDRVTINEFTDRFGIRQIDFEIASFGYSSYGNAVYLKFTHTTGVDIFYSNAFHISDEPSTVKDTVRLIYSCTGYFYGFDYTNSPYYQSIRVKGKLLARQDTTETKQYKKIDGYSYTDNPNRSDTKKGLFEEFTEQAGLALDVALKSEIVYIEGYRETGRQTLKIGDFLSNTNVQNIDVDLFFNKNVKFTESYQLTPNFEITVYQPFGSVNEAYLTEIDTLLRFNKDIILNTGTITLYKENGDLLHTFTESDFTNSGDNITFTGLISDYLDGFGGYYFLMSEGLVTSIIDEPISITNPLEWAFTYSDGDYDQDDYSEDYL